MVFLLLGGLEGPVPGGQPAPTERPLSALDPVTREEFKAGLGARLAIQIAGVWTDIAKSTPRLAVEFVSVRAATSRRLPRSWQPLERRTPGWLIGVAAPQAGVGAAGDDSPGYVPDPAPGCDFDADGVPESS